MLGHIYRLIADFEKTHGVHPNLLYLNRFHSEHLVEALDKAMTMSDIRDLLHMELIIDHDIVHPHVAWTHTANKLAS
jgi:hypothetical protein